MKRRLLIPLMENMTEAAIISFLGDLCTGAPARVAMSASPVASITRPARIASRPALLSVMTPRIARHSRLGSLADQRRLECLDHAELPEHGSGRRVHAIPGRFRRPEARTVARHGLRRGL